MVSMSAWLILTALAVLASGAPEGLHHNDWVEQLAGFFSPRRLQAALPALSALPRCAQHLERWAAGLHVGDKWAFQMVDSSAKLHAEMIFGKSIDLGNYDTCVSATSQGIDPVSGSYLLPWILAVNYNASQVGVAATALCVPASCEPGAMGTAVHHMLSALSEDMAIAGLAVNISLLRPPEPYRQRAPGVADWATVGLCAALLMMAFLATTIDVTVSENNRRQRLQPFLAFSLTSNAFRLAAVPTGRDVFLAISGLRVLSLLWVVLYHRWLITREWPINASAHSYEQERHKWIFLQAPLAVDTFFAIGGLVCCHSFFRNVTKTKRFNILEFYVQRILRLIPALAACVAFASTWMDLLGQGPLRSAQRAADYCRSWWWMTMLFVSNTAERLDMQCMPHTWYLAADMQLHVLAPLVLLPLWRWPRAGLGVLIACTLSSCLPGLLLTAHYGFLGPYGYYTRNEEETSVLVRTLYYSVYSRLSPYLVGVLTGYILFKDGTKKIPLLRSRIIVAVGWILSLFLFSTVIFGGMKVSTTLDNVDTVGNAFYIGFFRLCWAIAVCWVIVACATGRGGPVNALLSWTGFVFFGKLSYCVYLVHCLVQNVLNDWKRSPAYYTDITVFSEALADAGLSTLIGVALYLLVEEPFAQLLASIWRRADVKTKSSSSLPEPDPS